MKRLSSRNKLAARPVPDVAPALAPRPRRRSQGHSPMARSGVFRPGPRSPCSWRRSQCCSANRAGLLAGSRHSPLAASSPAALRDRQNGNRPMEGGVSPHPKLPNISSRGTAPAQQPFDPAALTPRNGRTWAGTSGLSRGFSGFRILIAIVFVASLGCIMLATFTTEDPDPAGAFHRHHRNRAVHGRPSYWMGAQPRNRTGRGS